MRYPLTRPLLRTFLLFFLVGLLMLSDRATAISPTLSISPSKFTIDAIAGQPQQAIIKLTNRSSVALPVKAVVMDFAPKDAKGTIAFDTALPGRSAKDWLRVKEPDFLFNPDQRKSIVVDISPPDTAEDGSYFAVVMFQTSLPSNYTDASGGSEATIVPWIGELFSINVGTPGALDDSSLSITRIEYPRFSTDTKVPISIEVKNNTNFQISPKTEFSLKSYLGPVVARAETEQTTILPGSSRIFTGQLTRTVALGLYAGQATVKAASYSKSVSTGPLYLFSVVALIVLGLITCSGALFHHGHRDRKKRQARAAAQ